MFVGTTLLFTILVQPVVADNNITKEIITGVLVKVENFVRVNEEQAKLLAEYRNTIGVFHSTIQQLMSAGYQQNGVAGGESFRHINSQKETLIKSEVFSFVSHL